MRTSVAMASALAAALWLAAGTRAAPPPEGKELDALLAREPIDTASWPRWSPRLRAWSGAPYEAAFPAFRAAFSFLRGQQKTRGNRITLPRPLDRDPVAWMVMAGAFLHEGSTGPGRVSAARQAQSAARSSMQRDRKMARAHFFLCQAYLLEQRTPHAQGGPARPDVGRLREALKELREAQALDPVVAWMPSEEAGRLAVAARQWDDAEAYLRTAWQEKPDADTARLLAQAVVEHAGPRPEPASAILRPLVERFPEDGVLASFHARALFQDNRKEEAVAELRKARKLGTDPATVLEPGKVKEIDEEGRRQAQAAAQKKAVEARKKAAEGRWTLLWILAGLVLTFTLFYAAVMGAMCLAGLWLARRTRAAQAAEMLGTVERVAPGGQVARTQHESRLTQWYVLALLAALLLFYASLPFVFGGLLLVFLLTLVLAVFTRRDQGTGDVQGALLKASSGGIAAVFKATFARTGTGGYGLSLERREYPRLFAAIDEVARRVDTEPPDEVFLSPGADFWVLQEGRGPFGVFGGRKRVLTLGLCVMNFLTVGELKSILAHEFAHFSHADTYWNRFLFQVTLSLRTAMREMARTGGWVTWINPFYWFFWLYSRSYSLLSAGFSRSREFLADRMACSLYGSDVFAPALRKVCTDGSHFEGFVYREIVRLLRQKKAYVNMYLAFRKLRDETMTETDRQKLHRKLLADRPSVFASHPTFTERMEAAKHLPRTSRNEDDSSLHLFENPEAVERELTDFLTEVVANNLHF